ncbi:MAG: hypothetical protein K0R05_2076 [Anaerocolumna sp.]|nr:hypothetical protein [Anaerocolumna sp.]
MSKKIMRCFGVLLSLVLMFNIVGSSVASAAENDVIQSQQYVVNGKEFTVNKVVTGDTIKLNITSPTMEDTLSYVINGDIVQVDYGFISETVNKSDYLTNVNDSIQSNPLVRAAAVTYGSKIISKFDDRYYYSRGSSGLQDYVKIGCNLNYQIRFDNLSQTRKDNVNTYITGINNSNSHFNSAVGYVGAEWVAIILTAAAGGVLIAALAPEALFVAIVAAGFTGTLGSATLAIVELTSGYSDFKDATNIYDTIKLYGTQI